MYCMWTQCKIWVNKREISLYFCTVIAVEICIFKEIRIKQIKAMAKEENNTKEGLEEQVEEKKKEALKRYEKLINRLKNERKELKDELNRDYREARRYVRSHPEEGVLFSFLGGIAIGFILGKIGRKWS